MAFSITSEAFDHKDGIPANYTCDALDVSPPLAWSGMPDGTQSLALIVDDPDAPDPAAPKMIWVHWLLYNLPASSNSLAEAATTDTLPNGTLEGRNDWKQTGYRGPCPPIGRHRYFFRLYALDAMLSDLEAPTKDELMKAMDGHVLAEAMLMGTYHRG